MKMIERTFQDIKPDQITDADHQSFLVNLGWSKGDLWEKLLQSKRILIVSEAGAGKTFECREQTRKLWSSGAPAFFIELADLAMKDLRSMLDDEEEERLNTWQSSQAEIATFFLDSIDELKLSQKSFEQALKNLKKVIGSQLHRVRIVVTTRPIPYDEELVRRILPVPPPVPSIELKEEAFAIHAMRESSRKNTQEKDKAADWRTVALMPLSDEQIADFALSEGILEPGALLDDLKKRNAQEFARRPQDLIELCADWHEHKRIRTHRDQVRANVHIKLQPGDNRPELAELSIDRAIEGASRLALAMLLTRRWTIRHSASSDDIRDGAALDPSIILSDWPPNERKALLERPLFGFASYGRVRFHHRSVAEFLAALRLGMLRDRGMPFRALQRLIFAKTKGKIIVRPSKRAVAGWLALTDYRIFEVLRENEPSVLFDEGDPESLTQIQRNQALDAYVARYGNGGWRGLHVPSIQIHRFSSAGLANTINQLWDAGVENPDVRKTLLELIETGRIDECASIVSRVACDRDFPTMERLIALDALIGLNDLKLKEIAHDLEHSSERWPKEVASGAILKMFPSHLTIEQLCATLDWIKPNSRRIGDLTFSLPRLIASVKIDAEQLDALRDGLSRLVSVGLRWDKQSSYVLNDRPDLVNALITTCVMGPRVDRSEPWLRACVLASRIPRGEYANEDELKVLKEYLANVSGSENEKLFWAEDAFVQSLRAFSDPRERYVAVVMNRGGFWLNADRDLAWIKRALSETDRSGVDRALLLEAAMRLSPNSVDWRDHIVGLKLVVADQLDLIELINERLKILKDNRQQLQWEKKEDQRKKQQARRHAKNRASWVQFWREVAQQPDSAFSEEKSEHTAWNLWKVMSHDGESSRSSGWDRQFIEEQFGSETADRLRCTLMKAWRAEKPTLASERAEAERNTFLVKWQLGLAAIYAESEDPEWARKLTDDEAELAARYALLELNGLPVWMESLVDYHRDSVDAILGTELDTELRYASGGRYTSMLLQSIGYATASVVQVFLPRLVVWLDTHKANFKDEHSLASSVTCYSQIINIAIKHGCKDIHSHLLKIAKERLLEDPPEEFAQIWLSVLLRLHPDDGVAGLEEKMRSIRPNKNSKAVSCIGGLLGDRQDSISLKDGLYSPQLLLRLLRLTYRHVRIKDDNMHEGSYSPNTRDHAERARNQIVNALFETKGEQGWTAKLEMASDPLCKHFKDRIIAIAENQWAQEIDSEMFTETQALALDRNGEASPSTNEAMFAVLNDRLADLDDLLLRDDSPREAWAGIHEERVMRREIARVIRHAANGVYTVDQEAVTADEKETDIRLRSTSSDHEAVIELKLADGRTGRDLHDTIRNQLVKKYMQAENSRSGCLLITIAKDRKWQHPNNGRQITLAQLSSILQDEARRVMDSLGGSVSLVVHILDLRPRLPKEREEK